MVELRKLDQVISEYNEAMRIDPSPSGPDDNIGICLAMRENLDQGEFRNKIRRPVRAALFSAIDARCNRIHFRSSRCSSPIFACR